MLAIALLAPAAAVAQSGAERQPTWWMPAEGSGWIPFHALESGHVIIPVTLNGEPASAVVDTGFNGMTISKRWADAHALKIAPGYSAPSVGGVTTTYYAHGVTMSVGDVRTEGPSTFEVVDLSAFSTISPEAIDAVIGLGLLSLVGRQVDQDGHRFRVLPSGRLTFTHPGSVRPGPNGGRMITDVRLGSGRPLVTMVDTGMDGALVVAADAAEAAGVKAVTDVAGAGAGGAMLDGLAAPMPIGVADRTVQGLNPEIAAADFGIIQPPIAAVIGMQVMGLYDLSVDLPRGLMQLDERRTPPQPEPKSTSGIQGMLVADRISIIHVMRNSPAADAGLRDGDAICRVDDWTATEAHAHRLGADTPGTHHTLRLCDGRTVALTARAFY